MRAPIITSTIVLDHFRGIGFEFPVGEEREVFINTEVPLDESWTVRKGTLFELDVFLRVEVECGFLTYVDFSFSISVVFLITIRM